MRGLLARMVYVFTVFILIFPSFLMSAENTYLNVPRILYYAKLFDVQMTAAGLHIFIMNHEFLAQNKEKTL